MQVFPQFWPWEVEAGGKKVKIRITYIWWAEWQRPPFSFRFLTLKIRKMHGRDPEGPSSLAGPFQVPVFLPQVAAQTMVRKQVPWQVTVWGRILQEPTSPWGPRKGWNGDEGGFWAVPLTTAITRSLPSACEITSHWGGKMVPYECRSLSMESDTQQRPPKCTELQSLLGGVGSAMAR